MNHLQYTFRNDDLTFQSNKFGTYVHGNPRTKTGKIDPADKLGALKRNV